MGPDDLPAGVNERTKLLNLGPQPRRFSLIQQEGEASSIITSHVSKDEHALSNATVGERLPYNDYTTIDWLHDLVKSSYRYRAIRSKEGLRNKLAKIFDSFSGWVAVAIIGVLTACVAFSVDVAEATVSDWKMGYCSHNIFAEKETCCTSKAPLPSRIWFRAAAGTREIMDPDQGCSDWVFWSDKYWHKYGIYVAFCVVFGVFSCSLTMLTKRNLPATAPGKGDKFASQDSDQPVGKAIYLAAGSGIPEIKTILSGFQIPHILDLHVMLVKAIGAVFAVATGMCLGKEGPFVHISTCIAYLVGMRFPKYSENGRKMRELLSAGCSAGLSVAFGAPIGGVLFSYEEISTYFPRKVLWRAFLCSLTAAVVLMILNPTGTGKLVLFETNYGGTYSFTHFMIFILLGILGGLWGGIFCKSNFLWSKTFRQLPLIKSNPVFEILLVVLATALLQFPNPLTQEPGDKVIKQLLQDCRTPSTQGSWLCRQEALPFHSMTYIGWLIHGTLIKLLLTTITFGCKVPSGIIIPALDAGAFTGRLIGQYVPDISPGIFAMVGAAAFLAGVSRMTISLCVIMFELTGELEYIVPHMTAILVAKWVADALEKEGVYDLAQTVLGHPFLDLDASIHLVQACRSDSGIGGVLVEKLLPPPQTVRDITVTVPKSNKVPRHVLVSKLEKLRARGLMDAGLVLVQEGICQGYLAEGELEFGLETLGKAFPEETEVRVLGDRADGLEGIGGEVPGGGGGGGGRRDEETGVLVAGPAAEFDLGSFVDRTPVCLCAKAPAEYAVEMFGKLGLRHLIVVEEGTGRCLGVIIKKRLVNWIDGLKHGHGS